MMDSILWYAQSEQFRPKQSLEAADLIRLVTPQANITNRLADPGFEKLGHWVTEGGRHEVDSSAAHGGKKSLKLITTEGDLAQNKNFVSGLSARGISFDKNPRHLKLAAWYKTESSSQRGGPTLTAAIRYRDAYIRSESFSVAMDAPTKNWRYMEKSMKVTGQIAYADVRLELSGVAGAVWVDDVFFGEAPPTTDPNESLVAARNDAADWQREKVTRTFKLPVWYKVDDGEWLRGSKVAVDHEGTHNLQIKQSETDSKPQQQTLNIDLTPPVVTLVIAPLPEQEAGIFTAKTDSVYTLTVADTLSGVKTIEYSTDGRQYASYTKPFKLSPGRHDLRCRATDRAGNESRAMTGEWITGSREELLEANVLPVGK
jgi:hypothetical protein